MTSFIYVSKTASAYLQYAERNEDDDDDDDELGQVHYNDMQFYLCLFFHGINHIWDEKKLYLCKYIYVCNVYYILHCQLKSAGSRVVSEKLHENKLRNESYAVTLDGTNNRKKRQERIIIK